MPFLLLDQAGPTRDGPETLAFVPSPQEHRHSNRAMRVVWFQPLAKTVSAMRTRPAEPQPLAVPGVEPTITMPTLEARCHLLFP